MVEARCARKPVRRCRSTQRTLRCSLMPSCIASRSRSGSPKCIKVLRPLTSTAQKFAEAPDQYPVFGEQQAPQTRLLARRAAPENRDRHEIHVVLGIGGRRGHELHQVARGARAQLEAGLFRGRQAELGADHAEHRQVGLALALQDVAHGPRPRREHCGGIVGFDGHPHPTADELADQPVPSLAQVRSLGSLPRRAPA